MNGELLDSFVRAIERLKERNRVRSMDQYRKPELSCGLENRDHPRVVWKDQPTGVVADSQPQVLPHLETAGTALLRPLKACDQRLGTLALGDESPVDMAERREASSVRTVVSIEILIKFIAPAPVEVHDGPDLQFIHQVEERRDIRDHPAAPGTHPRCQPPP